MKRTLAHLLRPIRLSQFIGQDALVESLKSQYKSGREPAAWMFVGPTGTGKTTAARIVAISLQCTHAEFGEPCDDCTRAAKNFSIREINASEQGRKEDMERLAQASVYMPQENSRRNVFILDEAQRATKDAQDLLLKYFEEAPDTTVWIVCTSEPGRLLPAFHRRCQMEELKLLGVEDTGRLVKRALRFIGNNKPAEPLINKLLESKIQSPGVILNVVEKYANGKKASEAIRSVVFGLDGLVICRAIEKGNWDAIRKETEKASNDELKGIRAQVSGYLRSCLERAIPGPRAGEFAKAIGRLAQVDSYTDATQGPATVATLYELCIMFAGPKEEVDDDDVGERRED